jgi:hypothetical protein
MTDTVTVALISSGGAVFIAFITGLFAVLAGRRNDSTDSQLLDALTALAECEARDRVRARHHR